ncbi:hypothetical protein CROQUDRAFT_86243 [Cronartium quercuum f. sp. fusiforme G11]|uniref:Uncharacterized protein n=1 Tax=Cronartium quercuum f. sp. fusiforme G11 TaxID=708437 RepID=A0A9P6NRH2_9BASI|nr:hypothetical protein CROQUDRAFT_86243 [Cronartium quercuum f. sp. fusiforme G11]
MALALNPASEAKFGHDTPFPMRHLPVFIAQLRHPHAALRHSTHTCNIVFSDLDTSTSFHSTSHFISRHPLGASTTSRFIKGLLSAAKEPFQM